MQLIAFLVVAAWVVLVAMAVRFGIESARVTRSQRLTAGRVRRNSR
jgi:hypothetical protein